MTVREMMSTNVACCKTDTPLREVAKLMVDCDCGEIPVADRDGRPVGVLTDRDIVCRAVARGRNPLELRAGDVMTSPPVTIPADVALSDCCDVLEQNQIRRVPVVDGEGKCIGIVSQADIARHASKTETAEVVQRVSQPTSGSAIAP